MKYAWIEEIVEGDELFQQGDEILDGEGNPFDPPQYEQIPYDPPQFEMVPTGAGPVVGLNRGAQEGESEGNITPQHLVWGMDNEFYKVIDYVFTAKSELEVQDIRDQREADKLAEEQRLADLEARVAMLEAEKESEGIHVYTPEQIRNYIDNQVDNAATAGEKLEVIKTILKKMAIYILK